MIERFLFTALAQGVQSVQDDPEILADLFEDFHSLSTDETSAIQTLFQKAPPTVVHGFARTEMTMPVYSIVLGTESERERYLSDDAGQVMDEDDPELGSDIYSSVWEHNYNILCYAEHPDVTRYIYEAAKSILITASDVFLPEGLFEIAFSGGDLEPDPRYIPEHLFVRQLQFRCQREFQRVDRGSRLRKAFQVAGIHVDKSGSSGDVGGVKTLVAPVSGQE